MISHEMFPTLITRHNVCKHLIRVYCQYNTSVITFHKTKIREEHSISRLASTKDSQCALTELQFYQNTAIIKSEIPTYLSLKYGRLSCFHTAQSKADYLNFASPVLNPIV